MQELRVIVSGRVQRVMFRDYTKRGARRLGLVGFVRNLPDGTVEVVAQGERAALEKLIERVQRGSLLSRVDDVRTEWQEPAAGFTSFDIRF